MNISITNKKIDFVMKLYLDDIEDALRLKNGFYKHDDFLKKHGLKSKEKDLIETRLGYEKILDFCHEILEIVNYQEINKILYF